MLKKKIKVVNMKTLHKQILLENLTNNFILPAFDAYKNNIENLDLASTTFANSPSIPNLTNLRSSWVNALLTWQDVAMLDFGPAEYIVS